MSVKVSTTTLHPATKYVAGVILGAIILAIEYLQSTNYQLTIATAGGIVLVIVMFLFHDLEPDATVPTNILTPSTKYLTFVKVTLRWMP